MLKSLAARIVFAPKDYADAREISDELGVTTVRARTVSRPFFDLSDSKSRRSRSVSISEQRRPLLLPQEVKALGSRQALIFYEGLWPIRCKKVRYFEDGRFRARLRPPPVVAPAPAVMSVPMSPAADAAGEPSSTPTPTQLTREARAEDIERLDTLTLEDFAAPLADVQLPEKGEGERLTAEEMNTAVESFLQSLREQ